MGPRRSRTGETSQTGTVSIQRMFSSDLVKFAQWKSQDLLLLAEVTGSIESWFRAEVAIATQKGFFGDVSDVSAEGGRNDLTFTQRGRKLAVEFKVAFNNKNLVGGYNGTGGIKKDLLKLRADSSFDEKYVAVFFAFYLKTASNRLPPSYTNTGHGVALQPPAGMLFEDFAPKLAAQVLKFVVPAPGKVHAIESSKERWLGFWCYKVA